jgi:hypothetical protein
MELTPKQEAKAIYEEFYLATKDSLDVLKIKSKQTALTCSIICVNRILATCPQKENEIFGISKGLKHWEQVKTELYNIE